MSNVLESKLKGSSIVMSRYNVKNFDIKFFKIIYINMYFSYVLLKNNLLSYYFSPFLFKLM